MAYEPQTKASIYDGERGIAEVRLSKDKRKVQVTMMESKEVYVLDAHECPDNLISGRFNVSLSTEADQMFNFHPANGLFKGKVNKFSARENEAPTPKLNQKWNYLYFTVWLEIVDPQEFRGITVPLTLRYNFGEVEEDGHAVVGYTNPKSKYTPVLQDFMNFTGVWTGPIKWTDNILPVLEARIKKEARTFQFVIKNGWIDSLIEDYGAQAANETPPWDEDEADASDPTPTPAPADAGSDFE